ncbi:MAG: HEAT repeat domain-containing protein [Candidatus Marinimicrobia bacterium]|nr:HEAT repeat domain-containing protein [Candidatus Neomarinimicrobiota bacterium]
MEENRGINPLQRSGLPISDGIGNWGDFAKLFITPFIIAAVAIGVFFMFTFFFSESKSQYDYLESIKIGGVNNRWHSAYMLSKIIRADSDKPFEDRFIRELLAIYENAKNDDPRIRRYLTLTLGYLSDPRSVKSLWDATEDADDETRLYALWSLGKLGAEGLQEKVLEYLNDPDPGMRKLAAHLLGSLDWDLSKSGLRAALSDPVDDVKWNAALSLAKLGDSAGIDILEMMLDRQYLSGHEQMDEILKEQTIKSAVYAIGTLQVEGLKERLNDLKDSDPNMKVRQAAIDALNMFEGNG